MTHVEITTAGHSITVDTPNPNDLDAVSDKALGLWRDTQFGIGPYAASGVQAERGDPQYASGHDAEAGPRPAHQPARYGFQHTDSTSR